MLSLWVSVALYLIIIYSNFIECISPRLDYEVPWGRALWLSWNPVSTHTQLTHRYVLGTHVKGRVGHDAGGPSQSPILLENVWALLSMDKS